MSKNIIITALISAAFALAKSCCSKVPSHLAPHSRWLDSANICRRSSNTERVEIPRTMARFCKYREACLDADVSLHRSGAELQVHFPDTQTMHWAQSNSTTKMLHQDTPSNIRARKLRHMKEGKASTIAVKRWDAKVQSETYAFP